MMRIIFNLFSILIITGLFISGIPADSYGETEREVYRAYLNAKKGSVEKNRLFTKYINMVRKKDEGDRDYSSSSNETAASVYEQYRNEKNSYRKKKLFRRYTELIQKEENSQSYRRKKISKGSDAIRRRTDNLTAGIINSGKYRKTDKKSLTPEMRRIEAKKAQALNYAKAIPESGYLIDLPPNPPAPVKKRKKRGLKGLFRKIEDTSEKTLGKTISGTMELMYGINKDPVLNERLRRVANYIDRVHDRDINIRYKVLNMNVVNAFAVPGGTIYLTPKMLNFITSDSELAFVVGHEVGHIVARHSMKSFEKGLAIDYLIRKSKLGNNQDAARLVNTFLTLKYSRKNEFEADTYGFNLMSAAGFNPYGSVSFMNKMKSVYEKKKNPKIFTWLSTHPSLHDRASRNASFYMNATKQNPYWKKINGK